MDTFERIQEREKQSKKFCTKHKLHKAQYWVLQGMVLESQMFTILINDLDEGIKHNIFKFAYICLTLWALTKIGASM